MKCSKKGKYCKYQTKGDTANFSHYEMTISLFSPADLKRTGLPSAQCVDLMSAWRLSLQRKRKVSGYIKASEAGKR